MYMSKMIISLEITLKILYKRPIPRDKKKLRELRYLPTYSIFLLHSSRAHEIEVRKGKRECAFPPCRSSIQPGCTSKQQQTQENYTERKMLARFISEMVDASAYMTDMCSPLIGWYYARQYETHANKQRL